MQRYVSSFVLTVIPLHKFMRKQGFHTIDDTLRNDNHCLKSGASNVYYCSMRTIIIYIYILYIYNLIYTIHIHIIIYILYIYAIIISAKKVSICILEFSL